jgi:hypothetical protein
VRAGSRTFIYLSAALNFEPMKKNVRPLEKENLSVRRLWM